MWTILYPGHTVEYAAWKLVEMRWLHLRPKLGISVCHPSKPPTHYGRNDRSTDSILGIKALISRRQLNA